MKRALGRWGTAIILSIATTAAPSAAELPLVLEVGAQDSLDQAITKANAAGGAVLRLSRESVYSLSDAVGKNGLEGGSGLPSVTAEIVIEGNGAVIERSQAPGTPRFRIFHVAPQGRLTLRNVTIRNGATEEHTDGAGIWNTGTLVLEGVTVTDNVAGDDGGGIRNDGVLKMINSVVTRNRASGGGGVGGGLYNLPVYGAGEATVLESTLSGNQAGDDGGGVWNSGTLVLQESALEGNSARSGGGGVRNSGSMTLTRCRIEKNQAGASGGGISALGPIEVSGTTISNNNAPDRQDCEGILTSKGKVIDLKSGGNCGLQEQI